MVVNIWEGDKKLEEERKPELLKDNPNLAYTFVVKHTVREQYSDFEHEMCPTCGKRTLVSAKPKIRKRQVTEIAGIPIVQTQKMRAILIQLAWSHKDPRYQAGYLKVKSELEKTGNLIETKCDINEVEQAMKKQQDMEKMRKKVERLRLAKAVKDQEQLLEDAKKALAKQGDEK